jgi:hypothetical protein
MKICIENSYLNCHGFYLLVQPFSVVSLESFKADDNDFKRPALHYWLWLRF